MSWRGFRYGVPLYLVMASAWPAFGGQVQAEAPRHQGRTLVEWQGDLQDPSPEVRGKAVQALVHFGPAAAPALSEALRDVSVQVRVVAAWKLGEMAPAATSAVPALAQSLGDVSVQVRQMAAWSLSRFGPAAKDAVQDLSRALRDSNVVVVATAAQALAAMGPEAKDASVALARAAYAEHSYVRENAANALRAIGPAAITEIRQQAERDPKLQPLLQDAINIIGQR